MRPDKTINAQIVHDAAAYLFWTLAETVSVADADDAVVESSGQCLLKQSFTTAVLCRYGFDKLHHEDQIEFANAIAVEAEHFAVKGQNMNGVIYAEDAQSGRSPSAQHIDTVPLRFMPTRVISDRRIEKLGSLCIRHPLPAVVFSDTEPHGGVIEVADTSCALGFHLPMFLANISCQKIGETLFVSKGIFHIPVPDTRLGDLWDSTIQNSIRFVSGIKFHGQSSDVAVEIEWKGESASAKT